MIRDGRIVAVGDYARVGRPARARSTPATLVVMPGTRRHARAHQRSGRTDWEGFEHATRAAAAGGVTTLVDMPLNSIPATTTRARARRRSGAPRAGRCHVDVGFWGGVVPGNARDLAPLAAAGVLGFKCFLCSVRRRRVRARQRERTCARRCRSLAALGLPLLVHAELPALLREPARRRRVAAMRRGSKSRPARAEHAAIDLLDRGSPREFGAHMHIVHLASAEALPAIAAARAARRARSRSRPARTT